MQTPHNTHYREIRVIALYACLWVLLAYLAFVLLVECLIWRLQPDTTGGVTIHVTDRSAKQVQRNLAGFEYDNRLYVSSNHWFRHWYKLALDNSSVVITKNGVRRPCKAIVVAGREQISVSRAYKMGFILRFICGFAPSKFLRLDPLGLPGVATPRGEELDSNSSPLRGILARQASPSAAGRKGLRCSDAYLA